MTATGINLRSVDGPLEIDVIATALRTPESGFDLGNGYVLPARHDKRQRVQHDMTPTVLTGDGYAVAGLMDFTDQDHTETLNPQGARAN